MTAIKVTPPKYDSGIRLHFFHLTLLSAICPASFGVTECTLQRPWEKITRKTEAAVLSGSGGRIRSSDVREWNNTIVCANERGNSAGSNCRFVGRLGGGEAGWGVVPHS